MSVIEVRPLGEVATVLRGTVPAKPTDREDGVPFFGLAEISAGGTAVTRLVEPDDGPTPTLLQRGDVVVALLSNIGQTALVMPRHEGAVLGRECAVIRAGSEITGAWIYVWTQSAQFHEQVARHTTGSTMPRLGYRAMPSLLIPVSSLDRQQDAAALLEEFDEALWNLGRVQSQVTELRSLEVELLLADLDGDE